MQNRTLHAVTPVRAARVTPLHTLPFVLPMTPRIAADIASLLPADSQLLLALETESAVRSVRTMLKLTWTLALGAAAMWVFAHTPYQP